MTTLEYRKLHDDHVQITADISLHTAALDKIATRLDSRTMHEKLWSQASFLTRLLDQRLKELRG